MHPDEQQVLRIGLLNIRVIWVALFFALGVYIIIAHLLGEEVVIGLEFSEGTGVAVGVLAAMAAVQLLLARRLRSRILSGRGAADGFGFMGTLLGLTGPSTSHPAVGRYFAAVVAASALCESVGIYGFVLYLMNGSYALLYGFIGVAALAMVFVRPRFAELEELAVRLDDHTERSGA